MLQQVAAQQQTARQTGEFQGRLCPPELQGDTGLSQRSKADTENKPRPAVPKLRIVIMVAGTRGDVQPFIALGLRLQVGGSFKCWDLAIDLAQITETCIT